MKQVCKYPLEIADRQQVEMPGGADILHVAVRDGQVWLWAMVDPHSSPVPVTILIVDTGSPVPDDWGLYLGTVQQGPFVWHVFEALQQEQQ